MAKDMTPLEALGRNVDHALGAYGAERERAVGAARRSFLDAALRRRVAEPRRVRYVVLAAAAVALVVGAVLYVGRPRALAFSADGKASAIETWIAAPAARAIPLTFTDGTIFRIEPASRARVVAIYEHGASVALENGALHADVVHTDRSAWRVIAGPMTVHVTGTRFDIRWSVSTEEFTVSVKQGSVAVTGPVLERAQPVRAGETLRVLVTEKRFELANRGAEKLGDSPASPPNAVPDAPAPQEAPALAAGSVPSTTPEGTPREDWRELAQRGLLKKAFAAAEASGFEAACRAASAAELLQLGDAARLSGRSDRANQALLALRARFPSDPRRAAAAFALGKVAFDQTHSYAQAAEWFSTSIREQPSGSLAREAAGRLVEAHKNAGNTAAAERAARDYLERYPNGPHADVARSVLR